MQPYSPRKFSEYELNWMKEKYPLLGPRVAAQTLGRSLQSVKSRAHELGLKFKKMFDYSRCNPDFNNKNFIYFLGFCWADGHVSKSGNKYHVSVTIQEEDGIVLREVFQAFASFKENYFKKEKKKNILSFSNRNQTLANILVENDYLNKSFLEPTKILSKIPKELLGYWWRGFFDGDGCLETCRNNFIMSFSGNYQYEWIELSKILGQKKHKIKRRINKAGKGRTSMLRLWRNSEILQFSFFMYPNLRFDIGLFRKYKKIIKCLKYFLSSRLNLKIFNGIICDANNYRKNGLTRSKYISLPKPSKKEIFNYFFKSDYIQET